MYGTQNLYTNQCSCSCYKYNEGYKGAGVNTYPRYGAEPQEIILFKDDTTIRWSQYCSKKLHLKNVKCRCSMYESVVSYPRLWGCTNVFKWCDDHKIIENSVCMFFYAVSMA